MIPSGLKSGIIIARSLKLHYTKGQKSDIMEYRYPDLRVFGGTYLFTVRKMAYSQLNNKNGHCHHFHPGFFQDIICFNLKHLT